MDQGLAAVLGALVGAAATGGGTYLTARATATLHKRQARREAYRSFLLDLEPLRARLFDLRALLVQAQQSSLTFPDGALDEQLDEIETLTKSLERHTVTVTLEGPDALAFEATQATLAAVKLKEVLFRWWGNYSQSPATDDEERRALTLQQEVNGHAANFGMAARRYV